MDKQDNKRLAQKHRRLKAMRRSYNFLNEWRKNDVWVGNVVHYHKPFSGQDHSFIISRANASLRDKQLYAFDIGTGAKLAMANDVLSLGGALSTKGFKIESVDKHYKCPFKPRKWLENDLRDSWNDDISWSEWQSLTVGYGSIALIAFGGKIVPYLIANGNFDENLTMFDEKSKIYLVDLTSGVIEGCEKETGSLYKHIHPKMIDSINYSPIALGTLTN